MNGILGEILDYKRREVAFRMKKISLGMLQKRTRPRNPGFPFLKALRTHKPVAVIAEIKKKSPSKGVIRKNFNPTAIARAYESAGAAALSVLTDSHFFGGSLETLKRVRRVTKLPLLRKDFVIHEYQIYEACHAGADAILLIAAALDREEIRSFTALAERLNLSVLCEIHDETDLKKILPLKPRIVGINNRDLKSFVVDLGATARLAPKLSKKTVIVSESGIVAPKDLDWVRRHGAGAVLVGESLMREPDVKAALQRLLARTP